MKNKFDVKKIFIIIFAIALGVGVPEFLTSDQEESANLDSVKFVRIVDGDTIIVEDEKGENQRVRMIGIDTPESVATDESRNNEYGKMASDYTKELLSNADTLYLEYDVDSEDQYDRTLAYVWIQDVSDTFNEENIENYMVNAIIVKNGYGIAKTYEPTTSHDDILKKLMDEAQNNKTGLWQYQGFIDLWD